MSTFRTCALMAVAGLISHSAHAAQAAPEELKQFLQGQTIALAVQSTPLEFKTKGAAIGGFLIGFVAGSVLGSPGAPGSGANAQQYMQTMTNAAAQVGGAIGSSVAKAMDAQGLSAGKLANDGPMTLLAPQLQMAFEQAYGNQWEDAKTGFFGQVEGRPNSTVYLKLSQPVWTVDFSMLSSDYELRYKLNLVIGEMGANVNKHIATCDGTYEQKMTEEEWRKDDSQAIADASKVIADRCLDSFLASLKIPRAPLPDTVNEGENESVATPAPEPSLQADLEKTEVEAETSN